MVMNRPFQTTHTCSLVSNLYIARMIFYIQVEKWLMVYYKGIKNGCPCIVEIRGTQGCALVGDPARAVGECRDVAKAQP